MIRDRVLMFRYIQCTQTVFFSFSHMLKHSLAHRKFLSRGIWSSKKNTNVKKAERKERYKRNKHHNDGWETSRRETERERKGKKIRRRKRKKERQVEENNN